MVQKTGKFDLERLVLTTLCTILCCVLGYSYALGYTAPPRKNRDYTIDLLRV